MIFDRYIFRDLCIATVFVALVLALVILLTESLKFLELIINAGASSGSFWILTLLAMPRFFEIILPMAAMAATVFVYNRMTMDSELIVMRATGFSPLRQARPAIALSLSTMFILFAVTVWLTPVSLSGLVLLREEIKAQVSTLLFREGVFTPVGDGLTVFIRERAANGELRGLMIHDSRSGKSPPVTIVARRGQLAMSDKGGQVIVFEGSRQQIDATGSALSQLAFDRYTIDLPEGSGPVSKRWREPEERSMAELLHPSPEDAKDRDIRRQFRIEIQRRLATPFLTLSFTLLALALLLVGPVDRRGQGRRVAAAILSVIAVEGTYTASLNIARHSNLGMVLMYLVIFLPIAGSLFFLYEKSEAVRRRWLSPHVFGRARS